MQVIPFTTIADLPRAPAHRPPPSRPRATARRVHASWCTTKPASLLERQAMRLFEVSPLVRSCSTDAPSLRLKLAAIVCTHTVHAIVHWRSGAPWLVQVEQERRTKDPSLRREFQRVGAAAAGQGYHFVVITERHVRAAALDDPEPESLERVPAFPCFRPAREDAEDVDPVASDLECRAMAALIAAFETAPSVKALRAFGTVDPDGGTAFEQLGYLSEEREADDDATEGWAS